MSVKPGAGGQAFCSDALSQIRSLQHQYNNPWIAVDGGVREQHILMLKQAGVNEVIMGHALINAPHPEDIIALIHAPLT